MQGFSLEIIGTHLSLSVDTDGDMRGVFHDIEKRLRDFEAKYSRFLEGNWLHDLNRNRRATLDTDGMSMLSFMLDLARKTDGYFDPTIGKRLTELGYGVITNYEGRIANKSAIPVIPAVPVIPAEVFDGKEGYPCGTGIQFSENQGKSSRKARNDRAGDYRDIEITGDEVNLHSDILLEFGGVGKGYLIDIIRNMLDDGLCHIDRNSPVSVANGVEISCSENPARFLDFENHRDRFSSLEMTETRYLINFGGDLYGKGGWKVGLESPFASDEVIGRITLEDDFLACSAGTKRKWGAHHHLIDPHTGESAREVVASYVEGGSGMMTDAYATTLCVMPWELAVETFEKTPEISGVIVRHDGALYQKGGSRAEVFV